MKEPAGVIELGFQRRGERTVAHKIYHHGNSRVSAGMGIRKYIEVPYYFLISVGGGFIEGETYTASMEVEPEAHAVVTTQAPTYIFKCNNHKQTVQEVDIRIDEQGILEYYADPVIPYKNAYYLQENRIEMAKGSTLIFLDGLTAGWSPDDKPFQYDEVGLKTVIHRDGELVLDDYLICNPKLDDMHGLGYFEGYQAYGSVVIIDDCIDKTVIDGMRDYLEAHHIDCLYGVTKLEKCGLVVRVLGANNHALRSTIFGSINYFREEVKGYDPLALRKNDH